MFVWRCGGAFLKRGVLLLLLLILAATLYSPASWADGTNPPTDPKPFTQGCGSGPGQTPCDATLIGPSGTVGVQLTFENGIAETDLINDSGKTLTHFSVSFKVNAGLTFNPCDTELNTLFTTCNYEGTVNGIATYDFSGGSLCSVNSDDIQVVHGVATYKSDGDHDDTCSGMILGLEATGTDKVTNGETVQGTFDVPEPSSALLLISGLAFGLVGLRSRRQRLA